MFVFVPLGSIPFIPPPPIPPRPMISYCISLFCFSWNETMHLPYIMIVSNFLIIVCTTSVLIVTALRPEDINYFQKCGIIEGNIRIVGIDLKKDPVNEEIFRQKPFGNVRIITGFLLVFGVTNLERYVPVSIIFH